MPSRHRLAGRSSSSVARPDASAPARRAGPAVRPGPRPEGPRPVHGLTGDRGQLRRRERLRRLVEAATRSRSSTGTRAPASSGSRRERGAASRAEGGGGCARAVGLDGANSVAVSADGRNVYATARDSSAVTAFDAKPQDRRPSPAARRLPLRAPAARMHAAAKPWWRRMRRRQLRWPQRLRRRVLRQRRRDLHARPSTGALTQPAGAAGCIAESNAACAPGIALGAVEGLAIRRDGSSLYTGSALSNAVAIITGPVHRGPLPGDRRQRLHHRRATQRLRNGRPARRRQRGRAQPR